MSKSKTTYPVRFGYEATFMDGVTMRGVSFNASVASVEIAMKRHEHYGAESHRELTVTRIVRCPELDVYEGATEKTSRLPDY